MAYIPTVEHVKSLMSGDSKSSYVPNEAIVKKIMSESGVFGITPEVQSKAQQELGEGNFEMMKAIPKGAKDQFLQQLNALIGKDYQRSPLPPSNYPEYAETGEAVGNMIGGSPLVLGAASAGGALGGLPGAIAGGALMGFGVTRGDIPGRAIGALEGAAGGLATKLKLSEIVKSFSKKVNAKKVAEKIQTAHDIKKYNSEKLFNKVSREAEQRGINKVNVDNKLFDEAEEYLAKTKANNELIEKARTGDYKSVRKLQSDLRLKGEKAKQSDSIADNDLGEQMLELKNEINRSVESHFRNTGNNDLADTLNEAIASYRDLKKTYYSHNRIAKMVDPQVRLIPKNALSMLSEESVQMNRLRKAHPEIIEELQLAKTKEEVSNMIKKLSTPAKIAVPGLTGYLLGKNK